MGFFINNNLFSWNEELENSIDVNQILLFFKIKQIEDLNGLSSYDDFLKSKTKLYNAINSFYNFPIQHGCYDVMDFLPKQIVDEYRQYGDDFYRDSILQYSNIDDFDKVCDFFQNKFKKNILKNLKYEINFSGQNSFVSLVFAENFRFKSEHDTKNLFSLPTQDRINVLPKNKDEIIFMIDFRQFEFRTFLNFQGITDFFHEKKIYEIIAKKLEMNEKDVKVAIIAYLYGNRINQKMEKFFRKNELISKLSNELIWFNDYPVYNPQNIDLNKKIHTTIQTISQFKYLEKLDIVFRELKGRKSSFIFPLHDSMIFSVHPDDFDLIDKIPELIEDDVYKIKSYVGKNLLEIEEI